jgi:hypothetical protein
VPPRTAGATSNPSLQSPRTIDPEQGPELGPPELDEYAFPEEDASWTAEWEHFANAIESGAPLLGGIDDARYAWARVEDAYASGPYAEMRSRAIQARVGTE